MVFSVLFRHRWLPAMLVYALLVAPLLAQNPPVTRPGILPKRGPATATRPPQLVAERGDVNPPAATAAADAANPNEHPLMPAMRWAYGGGGNIEKIQDYSATLAKRERINGKMAEYEYMFIKIRHKPFSVYMHFLGPPKLKGQEVIFVEGQNNGKMWAHGVGIRAAFGTVPLEPTSVIAMRDQHYPLTELGILNLVRRLVEIGEQDIKYGECEVKFIKEAKVNNRACTCIQVVHPVPRRNFIFHIARIYVDDALNLPIRFEAYEWPREPGGPPDPTEEYTYLNLKLNNGFTDADFDIRNPNYGFPKK